MDNEQYREFIHRDPRVFQSRFSAPTIHIQVEHMRRGPITAVQPGDTVCVDLRYIKGHEALISLGCQTPTSQSMSASATVCEWVGRSQQKSEAKCLVLDVMCRNWDKLDVHQFGSCKELVSSWVLITETWCLSATTANNYYDPTIQDTLDFQERRRRRGVVL